MPLKIGIQLYTVRQHAAADFKGTLKKVAEMGYEGVEFAGYFGLNAEELKETIDSLSLKPANSHVKFELLHNDLENQLNYADTLGLKTITIPRINTPTDPEIISQVRKIQAAAKELGIKLAYHNHSHEFEKEGGGYKLDIFYESLPGVEMELDTYWAVHAGADIPEYMDKYRGRLNTIHIKDMKADPEERKINANIGEGILNIAGYLKKADEFGLEWAFVEMDRCDGDELESSAISRRNIKAMGY